MRLYIVFLFFGFLFAIAGLLGLAGGIIGIVLWGVAVLFFLLGFISFRARAKAKGRSPGET